MTQRDGFSIRCPHCFEWTDWHTDPKQYLLDSSDAVAELFKDASRSRRDLPVYSKLLRCSSPSWHCPAPFEAFVCRDEQETAKLAKLAPPFSQTREFRLRGLDHNSWAQPHWGVLFFNQPVSRPSVVQLNQLFDAGLIKRALVGMELETDAPLTIYIRMLSGNGHGKNITWVPIEVYSRQDQIVPPHYNPLCEICRDAVMSDILQRLADRLEPSICEAQNIACLGRDGGDLPCETGDWSRCKAVLLEREKVCPCYRSDLRVIEQLDIAWRSAAQRHQVPVYRAPCWMGLEEIALPIIVHGHLVAVMMTGQIVIRGKTQLKPISEVIADYPILSEYREKLERLRSDFLRVEPSVGNCAAFVRSEEGLDALRSKLGANVKRIEDVAEARYREIRSRSEQAFKSEILARIEATKHLPQFFHLPVAEILERMRHFWGFEAAYLFAQLSPYTIPCLIAAVSSNKEESRILGVDTSPIHLDDVIPHPEHPITWLYDRDKVPERSIADRWKALFEDVINNYVLGVDPPVPDGRCYVVVIVPMREQIYALLFAVRNKGLDPNISPLDPSGVSEICQEKIFETCMEAVYEIADAHAYAKLRNNAWHEFASSVAHTICNELTPVNSLLDMLKDDLAAEIALGDEWTNKLPVMQKAIAMAIQKLGAIVNLRLRRRLKLEHVDLEDLLLDSMKAVIRADQLTLEVNPAVRDLYCDRAAMHDVFKELATNALRVGGPSVELKVAASRDTQSELGNVGATEPSILILFQDNGPGIPKKAVRSIFKPFHSWTEGGTGLGLYEVRCTIELHGGSISALSEKRGAKFRIILPRGGNIR